MRTFFIMTSFFLLLGLTSCNTVRVSYDFDRKADFSSYKTYAFHQKGIDVLKINDLDKRRIVEAIDQNLKTKGMILAQESLANIVVNISVSSKTKVNVDPWYNPWWGYGFYWGHRANISSYKEGTIIIDLVDKQKNILIWQGIGTGLNISNIKGKDQNIPKAVNEILSEYPPKK